MSSTLDLALPAVKMSSTLDLARALTEEEELMAEDARLSAELGFPEGKFKLCFVRAEPPSSIDLSRQHLTFVPVAQIAARAHSIGPSLLTLNLGFNKLIQVPDTLPPILDRLTRLELQNNQLVRLPANFGSHLTLLTDLFLQNNQLTRLPLSFGRMRKLRLLNLSNNPWVAGFRRFAGKSSEYEDMKKCANNTVVFFLQAEEMRKREIARTRARIIAESKAAAKLAAEKKKEADALAEAAAQLAEDRRTCSMAPPGTKRIFKNKDDKTDYNRFFRLTTRHQKK